MDWKPPRRKPISVTLTAELVDQIDRTAKNKEVPRSYAVEILLRLGYDRLVEMGTTNGDK